MRTNDLAPRLRAIMAGNSQKSPVTTGAVVTGISCNHRKSLLLPLFPPLPLENIGVEKSVSEVVTGVVTRPAAPERGRVQERAAIAADRAPCRPDPARPASDALSDSLRPAPVTASFEERRASVALLQDAMAAENERRRGWWREPVEGWREGRLVIRSALTGEATVIELPKGSVSR